MFMYLNRPSNVIHNFGAGSIAVGEVSPLHKLTMGIGMRTQKNTPKRRNGKGPSAPRTQQRPSATEPTRKRHQRGDIVGPEQSVRLNKAIADAGVASRRSADELIEQGKVTINRKVCTERGTKVGPEDVVAVNGEPITRTKHLTYVLLNKPKNTISTSSDEKGRTTVFDVVKIHQRLFTVGRLDRNTTGVLLITNDGELANRLMHPRYEISRVYKVGLDKPLDPRDGKRIAAGVELEDGPTQPCQVMIDPKEPSTVFLELAEGKNREVRRLFEHFGYEVRRLDRKQYAFLTTRGLARGEYRHLTRDEVAELRRLVKLKV